MEALVYTFLLVSTLRIIFFAIFFRKPTKVPIKKSKRFYDKRSKMNRCGSYNCKP